MERKQQSSIDLLPADLKAKLDEFLNDSRIQQYEATRKINDLLTAEGYKQRLSKSAVNRYDLRMREQGRRITEAREIADRFIGKLGNAPQGKVGAMVNEMLRTVIFDLSLKVSEQEFDEETATAITKQVKDLALAMQRLERSASLNQQREKEIREEAAKEMQDQAIKTLETLADRETIKKFRERFL